MIGSSFAGMMLANTRMNMAQFGQARALENEMALMNSPRLMFGGMGDTFSRSAGNMMANRKFQTFEALAQGAEEQQRKRLGYWIKNWFAGLGDK